MNRERSCYHEDRCDHSLRAIKELGIIMTLCCQSKSNLRAWAHIKKYLGSGNNFCSFCIR